MFRLSLFIFKNSLYYAEIKKKSSKLCLIVLESSYS